MHYTALPVGVEFCLCVYIPLCVWNIIRQSASVAAGALYFAYIYNAEHKRDGARLVLCAPNWAKIINTCKRCVYVRGSMLPPLILVHSVVHSALFVLDEQPGTRALIKFYLHWTNFQSGIR